jgi:hypothetical protein
MTMKKLRIHAGDVVVTAELNDSETARKLASVLPIEGEAQTWGEEIYFEIPLSVTEAADARRDMEVGEIAYWPPGRAFCIFFGPTPASRGKIPRAASIVNPLGRIIGDAKVLTRVEDGTPVVLEESP